MTGRGQTAGGKRYIGGGGGVKHLNLERNAELLGGLKPWGNKAEKFAGIIAEEFAEKVVGNSPKMGSDANEVRRTWPDFAF